MDRKTVTAILLGHVLCTSLAWAGDPDDYIIPGRAQLFDGTLSGVRQAYQTFTNGINDPNCSNNRELRFLHAAAGTAMLAIKDDGGSIDSVFELAREFGIDVLGDYWAPYFEPLGLELSVLLNEHDAYEIPAGAPDADGIRSIIDTSMIPQIDSCIADLNSISDSSGDRFRIFLDPNETRVLFDPNLPGLLYDLEVDYGEVLLLKGFLTALKGKLQSQVAYDLYVDPNDKLAEKVYGNCFNMNTDLLGPYPDLLKVLPTANDPSSGAAILAQARQHVIDAIGHYFDAIDYIRNEEDPQEDDLLYIDPNDELLVDAVNEKLIILRDSLMNDTVATYPAETTTAYNMYDANSAPLGQLALVYDFTSIEGSEGEWAVEPNEVYQVESFGIEGGNRIEVELEGHFVNDWVEHIWVWFEGALSDDRNAITNGVIEYWGWFDSESFSGREEGIWGELFSTEVVDANVDLNPIFGSSARYPTPVHPRHLLPEFDEWNGPLPGTMGHGLGDDATLGGIFPDMNQYDWQLLGDALQPGGLFIVSYRTITVDGSMSDWTSAQVVFEDMKGDTLYEEDSDPVSGVDVEKFYMAYDWQNLYGAITFHDNISNSIDYSYELLLSYAPGPTEVEYSALGAIKLEIHVSGGSATGSLYYRDSSAGYPSWNLLTSFQAAVGAKAVEFKIPLANIPGGLAGRFILLKCYGWDSTSYESDGEWNGTQLKIGGLGSSNLGTISGTVTYHNYSGAPIFVQAYTDPWDPEGSLVASAMMDTPGAYTLTGIGIGFKGYVRVFTPLFGFNVFAPDAWTVEASTSVTLTGAELNGVDLVLGHPTIDQPSITVPIEFGETISGSIDPSNEVHIYTFSADANDVVCISLAETVEDLEPEVRLYSPDGTLLEDQWTYDRIVVLHIVPDTGLYSILVSDHLIDDTGSYGIFVQRVNNPGNATSINFGETVSGSIDAAAEMDTYTLSATVDDTILISMTSSWGTFDPELRLFAPDGNQLAEAHSYGDTVAITHVLPDDGQYTVLASDYSGTGTGAYELSLSLTIFERLTLGDPYVGDIDTTDWHLFSVDVEAEKHFLVTLESLSSTGTLELYGRHGQAPTPTDYDYATKNMSIFGNYELLITPTESGTYYFGVYGKDIAGTMSYRITASIANRHVSNIYPQTINTSADATVHIRGMGFSSGMRVELRRASAPSIQAETVTVSYPTMIIAQFDLSTAPPGQYDISVIWPDDEEKTFEAFTEVKSLPQGALYVFDVNIVDTGIPSTYDIVIPEGLDNLFITLQQITLSWYGYGTTLSLLRNGGQIASTNGYNDLILQIAAPAPGDYTVRIIADQAGSGILTVWDALPELPLGDWVVGKIYHGYGSVYYQVQVPPNQDRLYFEAECIGLWSHFDVYCGQYGSGNHWVSPDAYEDRRTSIDIPNPASGMYIVEFLDSAWLHGTVDQSREVLIRASSTFTAEPPPNYLPTITSLSTDKGGNIGLVTVEIKGGWLDPNATISLVRTGYEDIIAQTVSGDSNRTTLTATFNLTGREIGQYNLTVTNPNGQQVTATNPFTIEQGGEAELWVEIVGRETIRVGRWATFIIRYGNSGNVNVPYPYVAVGLQNMFECEIENEFFTIPPGDVDPVVPDSELLHVTVLGVPELAPGTVREIVLRVRSSTTADGVLSAAITKDEAVVYASMFAFGRALYMDLAGTEGTRLSQSSDPTGGIVTADAPVFPYKDTSDTPLADAIMFWSHRGEWHAAKSLGNGDFIEIMPDGDGHDPDINIENLQENPYPGWDYWGAYSLPGEPVSEVELRARVDRLREKYGIDPSDPYNRSEYTGSYCNSEFIEDGLLKTYCFGLVFALNYDKIYMENGWLSEQKVYDNIRLPSDPTWQERMNGIGMRWDSDAISQEDAYCFPIFKDGLEKLFKSIGSTTPEDKYGPTGYDAPGTATGERKRFVRADRDHYYRVDYWNKEDATAPAYDVLVEDQLASALDWASFRFEDFGFLKWNIDLEPCQYFNVNVDTRPDMDWIVNVEGTFDPETGKATWWFKTLDPDTLQTPEDPMAGFLPPITESGEEIGWVSFTVRPEAGLPTGTQITNQAFVEFDHAGDLYNHPAPKEGPWTNTIDVGIPTSSVSPLPDTTETRLFLVEWSGQDDLNGSGIRGYDIYVSTDSNDYVLWLADTNDTSATFIGEGGHTYSFYSRARDNVGHVEPAPASPDSTTTSVWVTGDFGGPDSGPPDGYVDVWDLVQFADHWHTSEGGADWDATFDLAGPNFGDSDGYVDIWDLMVFADHWHEGEKP
ncbi:MAG: hypothetical protein AMJ75_00150 [Phycisphaerae bacterium SM1_79]|nr:MAG: hypothetical protein AMJ75_00150 [Phycisphaerae bacterium SM1_79]